MSTDTGHIPVLLKETLDLLRPEPGKTYADCTLGAGGHSRAIAEQIQPDGRLIAVDQDPAVLARTRELLKPDFGQTITFVHGPFGNLKTLLATQGVTQLTGGLLADIGVSSMQLDQGQRGFSFRQEAPLDMRMDTTAKHTAADVVNGYSEAELVRIFSEYAEERFSKTIAREITAKRPLHTTTELAELISGIYRRMTKGPADRFRIHPATRVFQALRIEVNDELGQLTSLLEQLPEILAPGAVAVFIAFHSLEDRVIKRALRDMARKADPPLLELLTKKPLTAGEDEIRHNPRSRSAKLRAARRL